MITLLHKRTTAKGLSQNVVVTFGCHSTFCRLLPSVVAAVNRSCRPKDAENLHIIFTTFISWGVSKNYINL